jgi:two-component system LytT family sensor kinase
MRYPDAADGLATAGDSPRGVRDGPPGTIERRGPLFWVIFVPVVLVGGSLHFLYAYLDDIARGRPGTLARRVLEEGTGTVTGGLLLTGVVALESRWPITRATWRRTVPIHLMGALVYSVLHTSLMAATRDVLSPLTGLGPYNYGRMTVRYFSELQNDVLVYATAITLLVAWRTWRTLRDRELRAAELERALAQAHLRNLQLRLQPHFLFNALNTISERMYEDPAAADTMMGQLSELLRQSLRAPAAHDVTLREEVALLENYIAIMRARFGDALSFVVEVDADAADASVPTLLLQPLVENAVRHGVGPRGYGCVEVRARRIGEWLDLAVTDDGVGIAHPTALLAGGLGLSTTRERLQLGYETAYSFEAANQPGGGFTVRIRIPYRPAPTVGDQAVAHPDAGIPARRMARSSSL